MHSNCDQAEFFLLCHASIMLFYNVQNITVIKVVYFLKICYHASFQNPILSGTTALTPHNSVSPLCCNYQLQKIKKYNFRVASNHIMYKPNFIKICPVVSQFKIQGDIINLMCVHFMLNFEEKKRTQRMSTQNQVHCCELTENTSY